MAYSSLGFREVAERAFQHWADFMQAQVGKMSARKLLLDRRAQLNPCATGFFEHCTRAQLGTGTALTVCSKLSGPSHWPGRPASWLWWHGPNDPVVVVDRRYIVSQLPPAGNLKKIVTRLILHETAHFVLHWKHLKPLQLGQAIASNPDQEEEAWWFTEIIIALAAGKVSRFFRKGPRPGHDQTWLYL